MKKTIHSGYDTRGHLYVACSECVRGGNGDHSCGAGGQHKRFHGEMCFSGEPLPEIKEILFNNRKDLQK